MAGKEATVYVVDVGATMAEKSHGRSQTNLDCALQYVWDKLTTTVATGRKTSMAGLIAFRTDGTSNELDNEADYQHITVITEVSQILMPQLRGFRKDLQPSKTMAGDAVSALVIAIQLIAKQCKKLQYARRIVLVTDARAAIQTDDMGQIVKKLNEDKIDLVVLGIDFDDADYGFNEENKDPMKAANEDMLKQLCEDCKSGVFGTLAQAVEELGIPRVKHTRPVHSYKGLLTLGNPEQFDTALSIDVERYPKTSVVRPPTASQFVVRQDMASSGQPTQSSHTMSNGDAGNQDGLAAVKNARTYRVDDPEAPGGKKELERDELARGYEYGRTAVHISESDQSVVNYETQQGMDILGFVDKNQYDQYLDMSKTNMIVSQKTNDKASMALSSFIHALYELESFAVARLVPKENKEPRILLLAPCIEPEFECLYDVELPYAEDMRSYRFPPLDRVVTVSGKVLKLHRNLPSDDLIDAMSDYVDTMDLSSFGKNDEGEPTEYAPPDETFSPMVHRINQVIKHRAIHPDADPPEPYEILTRYSRPPEELEARAVLNRVLKAADVKKVPPKVKGKLYRKDVPKPISDLDVAALLENDPTRKTKQIDPKNAIPEFKQILNTSESLAEVHDAVKQLARIIEDVIRHSVGDSGYGKALEMIGAMREEMLDLEEPAPFNEFLRALKGKVLGEELGGARKEMWYKIRVNRMGLINKAHCSVSDVSEDDAKAFMLAR